MENRILHPFPLASMEAARRHAVVSDPFASTLTNDLSRLPAPTVVAELSFDQILAERIADFRERVPSFDALLPSDPAMKLQEVDAYREMLARGTINDAAKAVMLAFAGGANLEQLAAIYGLTRRIIEPATNTAEAVLESDVELRRRVLLAPEAFASAGSRGGWLFHALSADVQVRDADIWSPAPGHVSVAVQSRTGTGAASADLVEKVRAHLAQLHIKPLTDVLSVSSVRGKLFVTSVEVIIPPGPAPQLVRDDVVASLRAAMEARRSPSRDVPRSALIAAAQIGPVDRVNLLAPASDIVCAHGELPICSAIEVQVSTYAG